ncbi:MAG: site-specific integrase [Acidimicrobiia bacterium]|nr:site-specific integrase [Acidimicrobiia bacterium]
MTQGCSAWLKGAVHDGAPVLVHRRRASAGAVQHTRGAALVGFLSGYSGLTLDAYRLDLRQFVAWCTERDVRLFGARRVDIEQFGRHLEGLGRARATVARRLGTIVCFYRYAEQEGLIERSPAVHVRRPRLDYESHATGLDRNEVGRPSRRGGTVRCPRSRVAVPPGPQRPPGVRGDRRRRRPPRARARPPGADRAPQRRQDRPDPARAPDRTSRRSRGRGTQRRTDLPGATAAGSIVTPPAGSCAAWLAAPGSRSESVPTPSATRSSPQRSTPAYPFETSTRHQAMPTRAPRCATTVAASPLTDTPPTSSQPSSPGPPGSRNGPFGSAKNAPERAICAACRRSAIDVRFFICWECFP